MLFNKKNIRNIMHACEFCIVLYSFIKIAENREKNCEIYFAIAAFHCSLRNLLLRFWAKFAKISSSKISSALVYSRKN